MKGVKAWLGKDEKNCSYKIFETKEEAKQFIKENIDHPIYWTYNRYGFDIIEVKKCKSSYCHELIEDTSKIPDPDYCLRCESIKFDCEQDRCCQ